MSEQARPITSDPEVYRRTPVFVGTRVLFQTLFDYLEGGRPTSEFLEDGDQRPGAHRSGTGEGFSDGWLGYAVASLATARIECCSWCRLTQPTSGSLGGAR